METEDLKKLLSELRGSYLDHSFTCEVEPCTCRILEIENEIDNLLKRIDDVE